MFREFTKLVCVLVFRNVKCKYNLAFHRYFCLLDSSVRHDAPCPKEKFKYRVIPYILRAFICVSARPYRTNTVQLIRQTETFDRLIPIVVASAFDGDGRASILFLPVRHFTRPKTDMVVSVNFATIDWLVTK